jgi:hypothetical protein
LDRFTESLARFGFVYFQFVSASMKRADSPYTCPDILYLFEDSFLGKPCPKVWSWLGMRSARYLSSPAALYRQLCSVEASSSRLIISWNTETWYGFTLALLFTLYEVSLVLISDNRITEYFIYSPHHVT